MVHTPILIEKAIGVPNAKKALDDEWDNLLGEGAWDSNTVREKDFIKNAKQKDKTLHFGTLMDLCHIKHAELSKEKPRYKGRVVFRGDIVKHEEGFYAVFSERGTSASHLAAAKFLDAVARTPGCEGQDSDAVSAYTQCDFGGEETSISLPKEEGKQAGISSKNQFAY